MFGIKTEDTKFEVPQIDLSNVPSIEIDLDFWKTLGPMDRARFLMQNFFKGKNSADKNKMLNTILKTTCRVGKSLFKTPEIRGWFSIAEHSLDLYNASMALTTLVKAKQPYKSTKNNDIAKLMGFPNGTYIDEDTMEVTSPMVEAFLEISDVAKKKHDIEIDSIHDDSKDAKKENEANALVYSKKVTIIGRYNVEQDVPDSGFKFAMVFNLTGTEGDENKTISVISGRIYFPVSGMGMDSDDFIDDLQKIFYHVYVDKVDATQNYIKINGTKFEVCPRITISENIVNINIPEITTACRKTLMQNRRRGVVLVGEPGTGKTIAVHKIMNNFRDRLVFWVAADSINTANGIRNVRKLFKMFEGCIVVFDDLDAAPLTSKNETTNEFLSMLDGTNKMSCFLIATVNDPSKIHMSLINRAERFDDIKLVKKPQTVEEVTDIIISKANQFGYYADNEKSTSMLIAKKGLITFNVKSKAFKDACKKVIDSGFTQVMVAGLISDIDAYAEHNEISVDTINTAINNRLESISCANMIAVKGRLEVSMDKLSDEAKASLINSSGR